MLKIRSVAVGIILVASTAFANVTIQEAFDTNPSTREWRVHGDTSLFRWNGQNIEATWDSRRPNSYFYRRLGNILAKSDDFSLSFDLRLNDIQTGIDPAKPSTFQIAVGFLNYRNATSAGFLRGTGIDSPNVVTFDYFPAFAGFAASISPGLASSNSQFAFAYTFYELATNVLFHVDMNFSASELKLITVVSTNGRTAAMVETFLPSGFEDFRVDAVAIASYSDAGQDPQYGGSILAHGVVDNVVVTMPNLPIRDLNWTWDGSRWRAQLTTRTNWIYSLERSTDLQAWIPVAALAGTGGAVILSDTNPPAQRAFYRVRAERP